MQTIIAPTDFSHISINAVYYAADMACALKADLLIVHASEFTFDLNKAHHEPRENELEIERKLHALKYAVVARANHTISVSSKQVVGLIENEIIKLCDYQNPVAVVMATHGPTVKEHFFVGSITIYLSKNIKCPVIVIPKELQYKPMHKILFATDLKNLYDLPIEKIKSITKIFKAKLDIVHVLSNENNFDTIQNQATELCIYLKDVDAQFHFIKNDNVYNALVDFACENNADIILTVPKKHAFFHKSESKRLIFNSPVAVMTMQ